MVIVMVMVTVMGDNISRLIGGIPANTVKPFPLRCLARARPNPVSHPVINTDLFYGRHH